MINLTPYLNRLDILHDTALQIIKDFGISGIEIKFLTQNQFTSTEYSETAYTELFSQILPLIEKLQKENFQNFYNLMYRIDLSETQIKNAVKNARDKSFSQVVTDLILKRELLKVLIRKNYSLGKGL